MNKQPISFISDLHLSTKDLSKLESFEYYCNELSIQFKAVYILGDLFDHWIGKDIDTTLQNRIYDAMKNAAKNTSLFYLKGNREILLPKHLISNTGAQWIEDLSTVDIFGHKALICHGDILCTQDMMHLRWLKISRYISKLFLKTPVTFRLWCLNKFRSHHQTQLTNNDCIDTNIINPIIDQSNSSYFIHGHTHVMELNRRTTGHREYTYVSLRSWDEEPNHTYIEYDGSIAFEKIHI